jgi:hypothetical protein
VQQVRSGRRYIDPQLALKLVFPNAALVPREKEVLALLMEGTPYATMAAQPTSVTIGRNVSRVDVGWQGESWILIFSNDRPMRQSGTTDRIRTIVTLNHQSAAS